MKATREQEEMNARGRSENLREFVRKEIGLRGQRVTQEETVCGEEAA